MVFCFFNTLICIRYLSLKCPPEIFSKVGSTIKLSAYIGTLVGLLYH